MFPVPPPLHFSCTSCFICMLWQAHVVWQIQQLVHKLRIRIYPFLLHIPRRTWSIIRRRFLKTVTLPALELSKRITLKRPPSPLPALVGQLWWLGCCVQLMWQPSSAGSILIALKNNKQNTCWLVAATTGHLPLAAPHRRGVKALTLCFYYSPPLRYSCSTISKGSINIFLLVLRDVFITCYTIFMWKHNCRLVAKGMCTKKRQKRKGNTVKTKQIWIIL